MLMNMINNRLTQKVNKASQVQERERRDVPNSTRRAFESQMKTDAAVARVASQNMEDAKAMVNIAQTNTTAIKSQLQKIQEILTDCAKSNFMDSNDYNSAKNTMRDHMAEIERIATNATFNGIHLMDGTTVTAQGGIGRASSGSAGEVELQAGNSQIHQNLINLLDSRLSDVLGLNVGSENMDLHANRLDTDLLSFTDASGAQASLDKINTYIDRIGAIEGQYSYNYKSLDNMSILFEEQADIFEATANRHSLSQNASSLSQSEILSQLLAQNNSSILQGST